MNTLFITRVFPDNLNSGDLIYTRSLLNHFLELSDNVTVLCSPGNDGEYFEDKLIIHSDLEYQTGILRELFSPLPVLPSRLNTSSNIATLKTVLKNNPDIIVIDHLFSLWALNTIINYDFKNGRPKIIYSTHNYESGIRAIESNVKSVRGIFSYIDKIKIDRLEKKASRFVSLLTAIVKNDLDQYSKIFPKGLVINPLYFKDIPPYKKREALTPKEVLILGSFHWSTKRRNLINFLKSYRKYGSSEILLKVIGNSPESFQVQILRDFPFVQFLRNVDDLRPHLKSARIGLLIDEVGGGFKLKLLDYAINSIPIFALNSAVNGSDFESSDVSFVFDKYSELILSMNEEVDNFDNINRASKNAYSTAVASYLVPNPSKLINGLSD
ncbi:hypothetical protein [uncultured Endozoicomonas sp.]|uniref:hypothetical protein n=1 Tax=uncultured Endozoicomonas sp. TaxID=432652 RepID=UPI0026300A7C|nr:hypothetical protein [uncultured Endozoicomonas sp.]